jgi:hypothetical protein
VSLLRLIARLRSKDARAASAEERRDLEEELMAAGRANSATCAAITSAHGVPLGLSLESGDVIRIPRAKALGHWGLWGPSGVGKSYALVSLLDGFLGAGLDSIWILDPKGETVDLMARLLLTRASAMNKREADALLSRVIVIEPFSDALLPPLQVLRVEPGMDPELHAWSMATLVTTAAGAEVGVRQESILHRTIECLIRASLPLTAVPIVLADPALVAKLGTHPVFAQTARLLAREKKDRLQGIAARIERLLRLKSTRLMLGGSAECLDLAHLMRGSIVLVDLSSPFGTSDVGRFVAGLVWQRVARAVLARPNGSPPTVVAIEELPEFLACGSGDAANTTERILRLGRSKGISFILLSQDLGSVGAVQTALPQVVRTNVHWHMVFRTTEDWKLMIRPTGRRLRAAGAPWETREVGYLSRAEESAAIAEEIANLPDRTAYLISRRYGLDPVRVRTNDLQLAQGDARTVAARLAAANVLTPVSVLERHDAQVRAKLAAFAHSAATTTAAPRVSSAASASAVSEQATSSSTPPPKRKRRAPLDLG